jgi:hypothetical protein
MSGIVMAGFVHFPGVVDHGMHDTAKRRQPGRPQARFRRRETVRSTERRERGLIVSGESDRFIVLMMAGNAALGKEATHGRAT